MSDAAKSGASPDEMKFVIPVYDQSEKTKEGEEVAETAIASAKTKPIGHWHI